MKVQIVLVAAYILLNFNLLQAVESDEFIYGDLLPNAPELAKRGAYKVGVRTLDAINPNQIDILNYNNDAKKIYQRKLTLEIWYPAELRADEKELTNYDDHLVSKTPFTFKGRAARDSAPLTNLSASPLIIISHGHPGSRVMMAYLAENLASKGYVIAAIDHSDSTHQDNYNNSYASSFLNRSVDQIFTLKHLDALNKDKNSFLYQIVDTNNTAIIGYSMGGYGALNSAGAGYDEEFINIASAAVTIPDNLLSSRQAGNKDYQASLDSRLKAIVLFAPWGGTASLEAQGFPKGIAAWDKGGLASITIPSLFISGSEDKTAFHEDGVKSLFEQSINSERYLLVYENGQHHIAPHPVPPEATLAKDAEHYAEAVWDLKRLNNINQHFISAFFDVYLKNKNQHDYLNLIEQSNSGIWHQDKNGNLSDKHNYWKGFKKGTAVGMEFLHRSSKN